MHCQVTWHFTLQLPDRSRPPAPHTLLSLHALWVSQMAITVSHYVHRWFSMSSISLLVECCYISSWPLVSSQAHKLTNWRGLWIKTQIKKETSCSVNKVYSVVYFCSSVQRSYKILYFQTVILIVHNISLSAILAAWFPNAINLLSDPRHCWDPQTGLCQTNYSIKKTKKKKINKMHKWILLLIFCVSNFWSFHFWSCYYFYRAGKIIIFYKFSVYSVH